MILLIDNYDSFTWNLAQYFGELGADVLVRRNDAITVKEIEALQPSHLVISPGPCTPNEAGVSLAVIEHFLERLPMLGVCLGHQAIAQVLGGKVVRAEQVMHGKTSAIHHRQQGIFRDLPNPFAATRYHSLIVESASFPASLDVTAWTENAAGEREYIMGFRHRELPVEAVQFHPEAILTEHGHQLLRNFVNQESATTRTV